MSELNNKMPISPQSIRKIKKIVPYAIIWLVAGVLYALIERGLLGNTTIYPSTGNIYEFKTSFLSVTIGSALMGIIFGLLEVTICKDIFKNKSFGVKIILKTHLYVMMVFIFLTLLTITTNSIQMDLPFYHADVGQSFIQFVSNFAFWSVVIYSGAFIFFGLFVAEVIDNLGMHAISNFFLGRYQHPKVEERIFMFLDMKSSTTIAEQLGHILYYKLLNAYYEDMTNAIVETEAEIYQYVGDEIVLSWNLDDGIKFLNCIRCFFMIKEQIAFKSDNYIKAYGVVPEFKAGLHMGKVTTGEIGVIKKDILFTGDVLNTSARIQGMCNGLSSEILISEDLKEKLQFDHHYQLNDMGQFELRGKDQKVGLYSVDMV